MRSVSRGIGWLLLVLVALIVGLVLVPGAAADPRRAPQAQPTAFLTPTPGPNGVIIYIVQEGDTLWRIAAIAGITLEELMALNGIQPGDFISPGMQLEIGRGGPAVSTSAPSVGDATPTEILLTPTPVTGSGEICVLLFNDQNGNGRFDEGETAVENGQISVVNVAGAMIGEHTTDMSVEGYCFPDIQNGDYNVSAAVPPEFNPTTGLSAPVVVNPGDIKFLQFGAQASAASGLTGERGDSRSTLLGVAGLVLLVSAGALGYYASRMGRRSPRSSR